MLSIGSIDYEWGDAPSKIDVQKFIKRFAFELAELQSPPHYRIGEKVYIYAVEGKNFTDFKLREVIRIKKSLHYDCDGLPVCNNTYLLLNPDDNTTEWRNHQIATEKQLNTYKHENL